MTKDFYKYKYELLYIDNHTKENTKSKLIDNVKGLHFYYYKKNNTSTYILDVTEKENNIYNVKEEIDKKIINQNISYSKLIKIINSRDELNFVSDYITKKTNNNNKIIPLSIEINIKNNKITGAFARLIKVTKGDNIITSSKFSRDKSNINDDIVKVDEEGNISITSKKNNQIIKI